METQQLCTIGYEVFEILNDLNTSVKKEIFYSSPNLINRKDSPYVHLRNIIKFGNKSIRSLGANMWN